MVKEDSFARKCLNVTHDGEAENVSINVTHDGEEEDCFSLSVLIMFM